MHNNKLHFSILIKCRWFSLVVHCIISCSSAYHYLYCRSSQHRYKRIIEQIYWMSAWSL